MTDHALIDSAKNILEVAPTSIIDLKLKRQDGSLQIDELRFEW
jgi:hypothetical protein